jgi:hypothetical protein
MFRDNSISTVSTPISPPPMAHVDVHERRARKEMIGFGGDYDQLGIAALADMAGGGDAGDAVTDDNDALAHTQAPGTGESTGIYPGSFQLITNAPSVNRQLSH